MPDADTRFSPAQLRILATVRANITGLADAATVSDLGRSVADCLRTEYPDLSDDTLGHLMANMAAYAQKFAEENPARPAAALGLVMAAAAIDLVSLDLEDGTDG
jgi:hypothetical protein